MLWLAMWSNWASDCRSATPAVRRSPSPQPARSPFEPCCRSEQCCVAHERRWSWRSHDRTFSGQSETAVVCLRGNALSFPRVLCPWNIRQNQVSKLEKLKAIHKNHNSKMTKQVNPDRQFIKALESFHIGWLIRESVTMPTRWVCWYSANAIQKHLC